MQPGSKSDSDKFIYIFHSVTTVGVETTPMIIDASLQESLAYQNGCKVMLQDLRGRFGDPKPLGSDDELMDQTVFNNQQMLAAFDCYKNTDKIVDGPNKGKLKLSWSDRYRRIEAIYEKLRSEKSTDSQTYYYMTKQRINIR